LKSRQAPDDGSLTCDHDIGVVGTQPLDRHIDLEPADIRVSEQDLPVEVRHLHHVRFDAMHTPDARHHQRQRRGASHTADADHQDRRPLQQQLHVPTRAARRAVHPAPQPSSSVVALPLRFGQLPRSHLGGVLDVAGADQITDRRSHIAFGAAREDPPHVDDHLIHRALPVNRRDQRRHPAVRVRYGGIDSPHGTADPDTTVAQLHWIMLGFYPRVHFLLPTIVGRRH
jgi:hypothetical protein